MRKNRTMRLAALLLALTLITSCFVGGTFAKYTSSASASSQARVAYWGFNSTEETELGLFDFEDTGILDGEENLIAPGSGNEITFKVLAANDINTAPEVDYVVRIGISGKSPAYAFLGSATPKLEYMDYPMGGVDGLLEWYITVDGNTTTYKTWKDFTKGVGELDGAGNYLGGTIYEAGQLPDILKGKDIKIGWKWPFENSFEGVSFNGHDTEAGNKALTDLGKIQLTINVTVEQYDGTAAPNIG